MNRSRRTTLKRCAFALTVLAAAWTAGPAAALPRNVLISPIGVQRFVFDKATPERIRTWAGRPTDTFDIGLGSMFLDYVWRPPHGYFYGAVKFNFTNGLTAPGGHRTLALIEVQDAGPLTPAMRAADSKRFRTDRGTHGSRDKRA